MLKPLVQLLYPPFCISCKTAGSSICINCKLQWQREIHHGRISRTPLYFARYYESTCSHLVLSAKESGNQVAKSILANAILRSIAKAKADLKLHGIIGIITIPSRASAIRSRGRDHIKDLAQLVVKAGKEIDLELVNLDLLRMTKKVKDQSMLNQAQRLLNISGAYLALHPEVPINNLIIIDDLITTGSSIQEAMRALSVINLRPVAVATACAVGAHL